jgi:large subunit ribosomal protein L24
MNIQKRHTKPRSIRDAQRAEAVGGVIETEGPIHVSNVMLVDPKTNKPTRVGISREGGQRQRVAKKSGEAID